MRSAGEYRAAAPEGLRERDDNLSAQRQPSIVSCDQLSVEHQAEIPQDLAFERGSRQAKYLCISFRPIPFA
jgi:hypothetical protein